MLLHACTAHEVIQYQGFSMHTIGKKLLEAREKMGISLRDASETTKIRADFLSNFENDAFDFDLPEIYKRGFVRNYARFLKLNTDDILADYTAQRLNTVSRSRKDGGNDLFGEIDLQPQKPTERKNAPKAASKPAVSPETQSLTNEPAGRVDDLGLDDTKESGISFEDKMLYLKIGTVVAGVLVAILIIIWLISLIGGGTTEETSPAEPTTQRQTQRETAAPAAATQTEPLTLVATGNVYAIIDEPHSGVEHFRGNMTAGQSRRLDVTAPVRIRLTAGENIEFEFRGERIRPSREGTGIVNLP